MRRLVGLLVLLSACSLLRRSGPPSPFPDNLPEPGSPEEAGALADQNAELRRAMDVYSLEAPDAGRQALEAFIERYPDSPHRPTAAALLARLSLYRGDVGRAQSLLDTHAVNSTDLPVRFMRGVLFARAGKGQAALELLTPFLDDGPPPLGPDEDEAEMTLLAATAEARASTGDIAQALATWERYAHDSDARPHEQAFARSRAEAVAARAADDVAVQIYQSARSDFARAALGAKAAARLRTRGDAEGALRVSQETVALRDRLGWEAEAGGVGPGDPFRLGLLAPFSGSAAVLGEFILAGAMMAIGETTHDGQPAPYELVVRDAAPERSAAGSKGAFELVREESAIGLVGAGDRGASDPAIRDGVPVLLLDGSNPAPASSAFQVLHSPEARAAELARRALGLGVRRFAILHPEGESGGRLADAFAAAVASGGGRVTARAGYAPQSSAFTAPVKRIARAPFEAVFVPDSAQRLELVAPALAVADLWPAPAAAAKSQSGGKRNVLLLSTAVGLGPRLLKNAGRYVNGALFAPGFYADNEDPRSAGFVGDFEALYSRSPGATDAYAYDAFRLLVSTVEGGAKSRADLLRALQATRFEGVTGSFRFDEGHARVDPPAVYVVEGNRIRALR